MHEKWSLIRLFTSLAMVGAEWVMWVLVALSVFSIAIMLERARFYWSLSDNLELLAEDLRNYLRKRDFDGARRRLESSPSPAASVALAGLNESEHGSESAEAAMAGQTARTKLVLERNLAFLGTVGNNAPFVGLLGTVIGIIQAFDKLNAQTAVAAGHAAAAAAQQSMGPTGEVMGKIAEALVATAIGLFVAIPAVAAFNYFQRKVRSIISSGDTLSNVVLAHLRAHDVPGAVATASVGSSGTASRATGESAKSKSSSKTESAEKSERNAAAKTATEPRDEKVAGSEE